MLYEIFTIGMPMTRIVLFRFLIAQLCIINGFSVKNPSKYFEGRFSLRIGVVLVGTIVTTARGPKVTYDMLVSEPLDISIAI